MIEHQTGSGLAAPVVGRVRARGTAFVRRTAISLSASGVAAGLGAVLTPWGMTTPWLAGLAGLVLASTFVIGTARDLRSYGQLWVTTSPTRLVLRGLRGVVEYELDKVAAVQVWCDCGSAAKSVAAHRDELEVVLRDGRAIRLISGTVFPPDTALTLSELLAPAGVKVVDWGEPE